MSSTPYVPSGGGGPTYDSPWTSYDEDDPHGQGLVTFAGVMLMIAAVLNTLWGIAAIDKANVFQQHARYVFGGNLSTWGWFVLALGVLQFFAALAIWRGASWARWFGVACASANAILQTLWLPSYPILALTILPLDIIAIYGLLAYGGRRRGVRAARAAGGRRCALSVHRRVGTQTTRTAGVGPCDNQGHGRRGRGLAAHPAVERSARAGRGASHGPRLDRRRRDLRHRGGLRRLRAVVDVGPALDRDRDCRHRPRRGRMCGAVAPARAPVAVSLLAVTLSSVSALAAMATLPAVFNAAIRVPLQTLAAIVALALAATAIFALLYPEVDGRGYGWQVLVGVLLTAVALGWGLFVRAQRQLFRELRERAEGKAREAERRRIAREMHDVLAHRLSILSVHAGALENAGAALPPEYVETAGVIRTSTRAALDELRQVIGLLREHEDGPVPEPPQPTLEQIPGLLEESRSAGLAVNYREDVRTRSGPLPARIRAAARGPRPRHACPARPSARRRT
jgi:hypothetical protein